MRSLSALPSHPADHAERYRNALDVLGPWLREQPALVWRGDWNCTLTGDLLGSPRHGRPLLEQLLRDLQLHVPTSPLARGAIEGMSSIDHVAVPDATAIARPVSALMDVSTRRLSDHEGYVVTSTGSTRLGAFGWIKERLT